MDISPLWISLRTATTATFIAFALGIAAARWMVFSRLRRKELIDGILILPLVFPPTVVGFLLLYLLGRSGPLGQILSAWGISVVFSWPATVIAAAVVAFPLMYRAAKGALEQVDANLLDAARTMGSSEWGVFWRVAVPLAWPGIASGTVLAFARALGEFGATLMLAGNIPGRTQTIPMAIYFAMETGNERVAAYWVIITVIISGAVIGGLNYFSRGRTAFNRFTRR